jgi:NTP pyrophosphatase (non-canonical NTP hydrolase)
MYTLTDYSVRRLTYRCYASHATRLRQRKRRMDLKDYLNQVKGYALPTALNREYLGLGLAAEAGEVAGVLAKAVRDNEGVVDHPKLVKELGDVMWFIVLLSSYYGIDPNKMLQANIDKLESRQQRNVIGGSGDDR